MGGARNSTASDVLSEPWTLTFPFTRTTGPVVGRFLLALRDKRFVGMRGPDGRVHVPPTGYDPHTGSALHEWVELPDTGVVIGHCWVPAPLPTHPRSEPFAWGLVRLDGASSCLVHVLLGPEGKLSTGMRVRARWAPQRRGHILDIEGFVAERGAKL